MTEQRNEDIVSEKAAKRYREEHISSLGQKDLILLLYDGGIKFAKEAKDAIEAEDFIRSYELIVKTRNIVTELLCMLNIEQNEEVATNLQRLYIYAIGRLTEANFTHETSLIDNVIVILQNLRSAWAELDFEKAITDAPPDNGRNGTAPNLAASHQADQNSRILSVTI